MDLLSIAFALAVAVFIFVTQIRHSPRRRRLFGVYSEPGRWFRLKYAAFLLLLRVRRWRRETRRDGGGLGVKSRETLEEMEAAQQMPDAAQFPHAVDAVYFNGADENRNFIIMAASRRQGGLMQCISILRLSGIGMLEHPQQPDTNFSSSDSTSFSKQDLRIRCEEPMKRWRIEFDGEMLLCPEGYAMQQPLTPVSPRPGRLVRVRMDLTWRSLHRQFDFDTDQEPHATAEAVASEPWSREFFESLQRLHQTHVEQFGEITGPVYIDDKLTAELRLQGARDHSFGNRRIWSDLYRYGLQYIHLAHTACSIAHTAC